MNDIHTSLRFVELAGIKRVPLSLAFGEGWGEAFILYFSDAVYIIFVRKGYDCTESPPRLVVL